MKVIIECSAKKPPAVSLKFLARVIKSSIKAAGCVFLQGKNITVSVAFISRNEMKKINKQYRKKDELTNVLSFAFYRKNDLAKEAKNNIFLGELLVFFQYVKKSATIHRVPPKQELAYVIAHGTLHLLGFTHGKKMFEIQDKVSQKLLLNQSL